MTFVYGKANKIQRNGIMKNAGIETARSRAGQRERESAIETEKEILGKTTRPPDVFVVSIPNTSTTYAMHTH